ncbi:MAG TPA: CHAD domain-containing protein [Acidimicrobiia bacterium]|nr:CHAD domain-containing protein [Acidimicrobiia bacterium]
MSGEITVSEVVRRAIRQSYERLVAHEADLRAGDDPESVHQARVATRRLRSDLRTFQPFLDERWANDLRADLRWLGAELGAVRDIEVQRDRLRAHAGQLPTAEAEASRRVVRRLDADRAAAKADLIAMLDEPRYEHGRAKLAAAAASPAFVAAARADAADALRGIVRARWKKLRRAVHKLGDNPPDDALHAVRIRAKRCRYAAEACEPAFAKRARRLSRSMANVQGVLGEHHDAVVAVTWLSKTAHECTPSEAYAVGMLAQVEREAAARARAAFPAVWAKADTKRVRGWL